MDENIKPILNIPDIKFTVLKEPKEGDGWHIEHHAELVKQIRIMQLKIEWIVEAIKILNDNFERLEKMKLWIKDAYDVAIHNLHNIFNSKQ